MAERHSRPVYKKVLSQNLTKLGEELCYNRNAKHNLVLFWEQGFRRVKNTVFATESTFLISKPLDFDDFATYSGYVVLDQGTT